MILTVIDYRLFNVFFILGKIDALVMDIAARRQYFVKICRIHYTNDLISEDIGCTAQVHELQCRSIDLLHFKLLVQHDKTIRSIAHHCVGKALRLILEVR